MALPRHKALTKDCHRQEEWGKSGDEQAKPEWPIKSIEMIFTLVMVGNHVYEGMGLSTIQKRATMCWWAQQSPSSLFRGRISLHSVALAGLECRPAGLREQPASVVSGLALKMCTTMPSVGLVFF